MVACELDCEISGELLGWRIVPWQALLLQRVLPSCGGLLLYLTAICFDLALVHEHFVNGSRGVATFSIFFIVLPAIISLVFTLASPPPSLKPEYEAYALHIEKTDCFWIMIQILNCLVFPVATVGRYCHQIFWWIESVFASWYDDDERTRDALRQVRSPSPIELYLFLQSFIHAAPIAIMNILEIMNQPRETEFDKVFLQSTSIIAASLRMASTATIYRRFQREKICGRKYPWNLNSAVVENETNSKIEAARNVDDEPIYESIEPRKLNMIDIINPSTSDGSRYINSDLIQFSPDVRDDGFFDSESDGSEYLKPITRNIHEDNSDDEYAKPVSIIERVAPRRSTQYTIERVEIIPPPIMPAPRMTLAAWADKMVENAESIPAWLSAPQRRKYNDEVIKEEPDLPVRVPRSFIRGLEPQDATAALTNFFGWYMFFVARLLSIAAFINVFPVTATVFLIAQYKITLLLLIVPQASTVRRCFYFFLSFVYLFCLMEFKVRFRHVRAWHVSWLVVNSIQIVIFTFLWATIDNSLNSWWRNYIVIVIFGSLILSYMCMLVYFVILKPKETIIYIKK